MNTCVHLLTLTNYWFRITRYTCYCSKLHYFVDLQLTLNTTTFNAYVWF